MRTGRIEANPHFVAPRVPAPQTENPALAEGTMSMSGTFATYNGSSGSASGVNYGASCAGAGASLPSIEKRAVNSRNVVTAPPPAPGCDYTVRAKHQIKFKEVPTSPSPLLGWVAKKRTNYCLAPYRAWSSDLKTTHTYLYGYTCTGASSQKAIYDTLGRIVFSNDGYGVPVCLTAPGRVLNGDASWDYVQFWPCDIYNPYQRWELDDGRLRPVLRQDLTMEWYGYYGIMSSSATSLLNKMIILDSKNMSKDFLIKRSKLNTHWYEMGIAFYDRRNQRYYPDYSNVYN
ncbi:DUF1561 family protein, partial [Piscirickettsia salmonis]